MKKESSPMPDSNATLEHHGMRGISGDNRNAQIAPLNQRYSEHHRVLRRDDLEDNEWLRIELEFFILTEILGADATTPHEAVATMTTAYQRTFSKWLELAEKRYVSHRYDSTTVQRQLARAWNSIESLLSPPRQ